MTPVLLVTMALGAAAFPTKGWPESTPETQGMDRAALDALDREFAAGKHGYVDGMLVIRHGAVVYEKTYDHAKEYERLFAGKGKPGIYNYYDPDWHPYYKHGPLHTMQSVSKSVTSALIGIAIGRGEIPGVDAKMMPYFAAFKVKSDPRRDAMKLRDVLTMTTGIRWDEETADYTDPANNCAAMEGSDDWIQYVLDQPMAAEPGTVYEYNSGATELLSYLIGKTTGKQADDYAKEHVFAPLGIDFYWKRTPKGLADTEGGLYLTARDLAKFGYLYLRDGVWEGRRIVPAGWVEESTRPRVSTGKYRYGYQWWTFEKETSPADTCYAAWGYGGQFLFVFPKLDLIAVFTGWNIYDKPELDPRFALERILNAVKTKP